jgi:hypothetical protein
MSSGNTDSGAAGRDGAAPRRDGGGTTVPGDDAGPRPDAGMRPPTAGGCPSSLPSDWLFCEDFEGGMAALDRFVEHSDAAHLAVVDDASHARSGTHALFVPSGADVGFEGGSATWSSWPTGYAELHLRA